MDSNSNSCNLSADKTKRVELINLFKSTTLISLHNKHYKTIRFLEFSLIFQ